MKLMKTTMELEELYRVSLVDKVWMSLSMSQWKGQSFTEHSTFDCQDCWWVICQVI